MLIKLTNDPKSVLAIIWLAGSGIVFFLMFAMTAAGGFQVYIDCDPNMESCPPTDISRSAWEWYLPTILPTLSLIVSTFVVDATANRKSFTKANSTLYPITIGISIFYLTLIFLTISVTPFVEAYRMTRRDDWLQLSNIWLAPIQGLTVAAMGAYFINRKAEEESKSKKDSDKI